MHRRTFGLALLATAGGLTACSDREPTAARTTAAPSTAAPDTITPSAAAPIPATAPTRRFAVDVRKLSLKRGADRPLPTTVWQPEGTGPFPLILFSHGLTARPSSYADLLSAWARAGFVVAAPAYPHTSAGAAEFNVLDVLNQPADASYAITEVLDALDGTADPDRVAAAGHSAGGVTTIGMFTSGRDARLKAGVVLAGRQVLGSPYAGPAAPLLFVHGRRDPTVAYADGRAAYDAVPWPKALLSVTRGGHVATGGALGVVTATSTDFWRWSLYGDRSARTRLRADARRGDLATFDDRL